MTTSIYMDGNKNYMMANQSIVQILYAPLFTGILDYLDLTQRKSLGGANARSVAMYSSGITLVTKVINDLFAQKLVNDNNIFIGNKRITSLLAGPVINASLAYVVYRTEFFNKLPYYAPSTSEIFLKYSLLYFISDTFEDMLIR